jgi:hypothetical protein
LATAISQILAVSAHATVPNTFSSGTAAKASEVNANFAYLDDKATGLDTTVTRIDGEVGTLYDSVGGLYDDVDELRTRVETLEDQCDGNGGSVSEPYTTVDIDCNDNSAALADALGSVRNASTRTTYNVSGSCDGVEIARSDVKIVGESGAEITALMDGDEEFESLFIDAQSNVRIETITITNGIYARHNSSIRLNDVFFTPVASADDSNIVLNTSYLRVDSGSITDVALHARRNSTVDIKDEVTGNANFAVADVNSSILIESSNVNFGEVSAVGSSFVYASNLIADEVVSEQNSVIEADYIEATNRIEAWGTSRIAVWGDVASDGEIVIKHGSSFTVEGSLTSGVMECQQSSTFSIGGNLTLTGTFEWNNVESIGLHMGCHGMFGTNDYDGGTTSTLSTPGGDNTYFGIDQYSSLRNGDWEELSYDDYNDYPTEP